jgi:amidase
MSDELGQFDAHAQAEIVRRGELSPLELVDAAIRRIEQFDPQLGAVILPAFDRAREHARTLVRQRRQPAEAPPFLGVPFLMKDLGGQQAGLPCHMGMQFLKQAGWTEATDSYLTRRVRAAGFVILGRTNTPELGLLPTTEPTAYGATRNPWRLTHSAGGSSGGAAAAVAAGLVPVAHASDGGGSIRIPAAHCGLVGLKPTRGRTSFGPLAGERWAGFSCELVVSRSVRDTAALLDAVSGGAVGDPYVAPPPARPYVTEVTQPRTRLRIGVMLRAPGGETPLHPDCAQVARLAAKALAELGHAVEESYPEALDDPERVRAFVTVVAASVARALDAAGDKVGRAVREHDVEPLTWALAEMGRGCTAAQYLATLESVHAFSRRLCAWWEQGFDLLLTPTTAQPPPPLGSFTGTADAPLQGFVRAAPFGVFTSAFNMSGQPAVSLPLHWTADGLPVGAHLVARSGREDLLLQVAAQLETARPWRTRVPPLWAGAPA